MAAMQVLAATLTIAFEGLMLFHGPGAKEKTHVMIVDAENHHPHVRVNGQRIPLNKGDIVSFSTGAGVATTDQQYDELVPDLKDHIFFGNIDREVAEKDVAHHDGTIARVDLPSGELTTLDSFTKGVKLDSIISAASEHCFPRYVVLMTRAPLPVTVMITNALHPSEAARTYTSKDGIVIVSSVPPETNDPENTHFHEYRRMTSRLAILERAKLIPGKCDPHKPVPAKLDPEVVTALRGGVRIPNGDCSATDNP